MSTRVAFSVIGGPHQVYHIVPVAAALSIAMPEATIFVLVSDERLLKLAEHAASFYPGAFLRYRVLRRSWLCDLAAGLWRHSSLAKTPLLWRNRRLFDTFDVIVVAECTSTNLRRMGVRRPRLFCIPHGAGDRAVSFEARFRRFNRIGVAGLKTAERMIASNVHPDSVKVIGYPKEDLIRRMSVKPFRLFDNSRPTVFYNPHFRRKLSSLDHAQSIARAFAADGRFNLIVAPHIRAFDDASPRVLAEWAAITVPDRIMVDTGTDRLFDMSYCVSADIYLGDVSSQVYEFLLRPRPCVFLNSHGVNWTESPDYAFWRLGEVVDPANVIRAIERAQSVHARYLAAQRAAVSMTFAQFDDPCALAAREIISCAMEPTIESGRWTGGTRTYAVSVRPPTSKQSGTTTQLRLSANLVVVLNAPMINRFIAVVF